MKRNITLEQLSSLSEFGRENLWRYFEPIFTKELGAMTPEEQKKMGNIMMGKVIPLLDIPTMIEYLSTNSTVKMEQWNDEYKYWRVGLNWFSEDDYCYVVEKKELCDALWELVKELLED